MANLSDLADYIAEDNPTAAGTMLERVASAIARLQAHPALGRPGRVPNTRELVIPHSPYVVPYRVQADHIEILRVFHGARRWPDDF